MANRGPLHAVEAIFYTTAFLLAAGGLTWYLVLLLR